MKRGRPRKYAKPVATSSVAIEIRPGHWVTVRGIPEDMRHEESNKINNVITYYRKLMDYAREPVEARLP